MEHRAQLSEFMFEDVLADPMHLVFGRNPEILPGGQTGSGREQFFFYTTEELGRRREFGRSKERNSPRLVPTFSLQCGA